MPSLSLSPSLLVITFAITSRHLSAPFYSINKTTFQVEKLLITTKYGIFKLDTACLLACLLAVDCTAYRLPVLTSPDRALQKLNSMLGQNISSAINIFCTQSTDTLCLPIDFLRNDVLLHAIPFQ